jgi:hypothetical protein
VARRPGRPQLVKATAVATLLVDRLERLDPQLPAGGAGIEQIKVD